MRGAVLLSVAVGILLLSAVGSAQDLEVSLDKTMSTILLRQSTAYTLTVENTGSREALFTVRVDGPHLNWLQTPPFLFTAGPGEAEQVRLVFYPTGTERGTFDYTATLIVDGEEIAGEPFSLEVLDPVAVEDFTARLGVNQLTADLTLRAVGVQQTGILFELMDNGGSIITSVDVPPQQLHSIQTVSKTVDFTEELMAGTYRLRATLSGPTILAGVTAETPLGIVAVHDVRKQVFRDGNPFFEIVTIRLTNTGNVVEEDYVVETGAPTNLLTGFITNPTGCREEGGVRACSFVVDSLAPGETTEIAYRLDFWPLYVPFVLAAVVAAILIGGSFVHVTTPKLNKRHMVSGGRHMVYLEVRNPFLHTLENVTVRDWISPLAQFVPEFDLVKPLIRKSETGTELLWKVGTVKPKDQLVLGYTIKPLVGGELKMPRAHLRFTDKAGRKKRVVSKPLVIAN